MLKVTLLTICLLSIIKYHKNKMKAMVFDKKIFMTNCVAFLFFFAYFNVEFFASVACIGGISRFLFLCVAVFQNSKVLLTFLCCYRFIK